MSDDLVKRLGRLARMAETANHGTDEHRLMPAPGVADTVYEAKDRIVELEAQVRKADALADILAAAMHEHDTSNYGYGEENLWTMQEWFSDEDRAAIAAYRATKEGGA